jgi:hypothetical protein
MHSHEQRGDQTLSGVRQIGIWQEVLAAASARSTDREWRGTPCPILAGR